MPRRPWRRVLVRAVNWIGDAVMSVPALRELRALLPEARIDLAARAPVDRLFDRAPYVDRVIRVGRGWAGQGVAWSLRRERYDLALLLPNSLDAGLFAWLARVPERAGYATDARGPLLTRRARDRCQGLHQTRRYLDLLTQVGLSARDYRAPSWPIDLSLGWPGDLAAQGRAVVARCGLPGGPLVAVHPGAAYGPAKRWPAERFGAVAQLLASRGAAVAVVGGPGEEALAAEVVAASAGRAHSLAGRTTLEELIAVLSAADLVLVNDSGPMHLAAALDRPMVALFGSTDPVATGPLGTRVRVIRFPVPCSPCFARDCPLGHLDCFRGISVEEVAEACYSGIAST